MVTGAGAFEAASAFGKYHRAPHGGVQASFFQFRSRIFLGLLAVHAYDAHQPLGHNAVQRGHEVVWLDAHVNETADDVGDVVGVHGGEYEVTGERGLNGDLCGFLVADFADHDLIRVMAQDGAQTAGEGEALFLVDGNLGDAAQLVFDGIFDGDDFVFVALDFVNGRVQRGGLAGTRWPGDQHHAVRFADVTAKFLHFVGGETHDVEAQVGKFFRKRFFVQYAKHGVFAVAGGHDGDAQVDKPAFVLHAETAVLRHAAFGDVQIAEHLDARNQIGVPFLGHILHGVLQHAVDAILDGHFAVAGFNVNVTGAAFERGEDDGFDQPHDRVLRGVAGEAIAGDGFVAL